MNYVFKAQSFSNQVLILLRHLAEKSKFCWTVNRSVCTPWRSPQSPPLSLSLVCYEEPLFCPRTELQSRFCGQAQWDSLLQSLRSKSRLYLQKFSLTELVKRHNASPLIKPLSIKNGWQDEKCVY